jgi:carbon storage regulator
MLVLTRRVDESIVLPGSDVSITILRISGGRVQIGIRAPQHVEVHRQEVWERLRTPALTAPTATVNPTLPSLPLPR